MKEMLERAIAMSLEVEEEQEEETFSIEGEFLKKKARKPQS